MNNDVKHLNLAGRPTEPVNFTADSIRLADLLSDALSGGILTTNEQYELDALVRRVPRLTDERGVVVDELSIGMSIGAATLAAAGPKSTMPSDVKARLLQRGRESARENAQNTGEKVGIDASQRAPVISSVAQNGPDAAVAGRIAPDTSLNPSTGLSMNQNGQSNTVSGSGGGLGFAGWLVAAASIAFAAFTYVNTRPPAVQGLNDRAAALVAQAGTVTLAWTPMGERSKAGVTGSVIWNDRQQTGFIKFKGVKPNDPAIEQFQLWVFDKKHGAIPTTAGVFDVRTADATATDGEYIIEIKPALNVANAEMFAISVEKPGGSMSPNTSDLVMTAPVNK